MVRRNTQCQGLSHLDLCHVEAVQSSYRRCLLAAIIRAGNHTHQQYLWRETQYDQYTPLLHREFTSPQAFSGTRFICSFCSGGLLIRSEQVRRLCSSVWSDSVGKNNSLIQKAELTSLLFLNHTFTTGAECFHDAGKQHVHKRQSFSVLMEQQHNVKKLKKHTMTFISYLMNKKPKTWSTLFFAFYMVTWPKIDTLSS